MDEIITTELTEIAAAEDTTPEAAAAETETPEQDAADTPETPEGGADQPEDTAAQETDPQEEPPAPVFTVPVKYNKQYRELSPEEASTYAQKGMKYDELEPQLAKMRFVSSQTGQPLSEVMDSVFNAYDKLYRDQIKEQVGNNETLINELMEARNIKNKSAFDAMLAAEAKAAEADKENNNQRMAAQFAELREVFPDIAKIEDVPKSVMQSAVRSGRDLLSEFLRYTHSEAKRTKQAEEQRAAANAASMGSQQGGEPPADNPEISAMLSGVWH